MQGWTDNALGRVFRDPESEPHALSSGAIAGIAVGAVVAFALIVSAIYYAWKRLHSKTQARPHCVVGQSPDWQAPDRGERKVIGAATEY